MTHLSLSAALLIQVSKDMPSVSEEKATTKVGASSLAPNTSSPMPAPAEPAGPLLRSLSATEQTTQVGRMMYMHSQRDSLAHSGICSHHASPTSAQPSNRGCQPHQHGPTAALEPAFSTTIRTASSLLLPRCKYTVALFICTPFSRTRCATLSALLCRWTCLPCPHPRLLLHHPATHLWIRAPPPPPVRPRALPHRPPTSRTSAAPTSHLPTPPSPPHQLAHAIVRAAYRSLLFLSLFQAHLRPPPPPHAPGTMARVTVRLCAARQSCATPPTPHHHLQPLLPLRRARALRSHQWQHLTRWP